MKAPLFSSRRNHYYPYGLTFADVGKGSSLQPYKFGGKEPDAMYGLNIHDFHARTRTPDLARFTRPAPSQRRHLTSHPTSSAPTTPSTTPTRPEWTITELTIWGISPSFQLMMT